MSIQQTLDKLFSLHQFGIKLGLESTQKLLNEIGNPHEKLKCFHLAGSNGKGSTSSFIASILMEHGFKVGLYTSPHFVRFNERIKINGVEIQDEDIVDYVQKLDKYINEQKPTFFELTTALAFKYFEEQNVDYAVIETGLGGRLDATNVIDPIASIITSISLEHTSHLGNTIDQIAFEKAGIIKNSKPVFVGDVDIESLNVIEKKAKENECALFLLNNFSNCIQDYRSIRTAIGEFSVYETPLLGIHQLKNVSIAIKVVAETIEKASAVHVSRGVTRVIHNTKIEGRYEIFKNRPRIIFDSAHNPEGVESFVAQFSKEYQSYKYRVLVFGAMRDKNIKQMLENLTGYFDEIFISSISDERAANYGEIKEILHDNSFRVKPLENPELFIDEFSKTNEKSCLVILGSMYLLGEIKSKILQKKLDIEGAGV